MSAAAWKKFWNGWIKHIAVIVTVLFGIIVATWSVKTEIHEGDAALAKQIYAVEKDLAIIKTVLLMKGIMPDAVAANTTEIMEH